MELNLFFLIVIVSAAHVVVFALVSRKRKDKIPTNWPVVGMFPDLLLNKGRFHEWVVELLAETNLTFHLRGPVNLLLTADPANVHHIMSQRFDNYPKGEMFAEIFDIIGDGIFSADFELWKYQRRVAHAFLTHPRFNRFLSRTVWSKAETGLIPIFENACRTGQVVDLEDLFQRFSFDTICTLITGKDPCSLSMDLPDVPFCKALDDAEEVLFYRHTLPKSIWKLQRWLGVGQERKMKGAWETLDDFIYKCLTSKKQELLLKNKNKNKLGTHIEEEQEEEEEDYDHDHDHGVDLLTLYMEKGRNCKGFDLGLDDDDQSISKFKSKSKSKSDSNNDEDFRFSDKFLRDMFLNLLIAGRDTTSSALTWFFWLLSNNPIAEAKIRQEIFTDVDNFSNNNFHNKQHQQKCKLPYLHAALCETLRLYPPVPTEHKSPILPDTLPSGHRVDRHTKILIHLYTMARMKSVWGEDCSEFKPERWITNRGNVKHEPSYKFLAFNAGPRTCLGKDMAFTQMKAVVSTILMRGYRLQVVDPHMVDSQVSIILHTKHGLKVKVSKQ